jgi:hypothetical protein
MESNGIIKNRPISPIVAIVRVHTQDDTRQSSHKRSDRKQT